MPRAFSSSGRTCPSWASPRRRRRRLGEPSSCGPMSSWSTSCSRGRAVLARVLKSRLPARRSRDWRGAGLGPSRGRFRFAHVTGIPGICVAHRADRVVICSGCSARWRAMVPADALLRLRACAADHASSGDLQDLLGRLVHGASRRERTEVQPGRNDWLRVPAPVERSDRRAPAQDAATRRARVTPHPRPRASRGGCAPSERKMGSRPGTARSRPALTWTDRVLPVGARRARQRLLRRA